MDPDGFQRRVGRPVRELVYELERRGQSLVVVGVFAAAPYEAADRGEDVLGAVTVDKALVLEELSAPTGELPRAVSLHIPVQVFVCEGDDLRQLRWWCHIERGVDVLLAFCLIHTGAKNTVRGLAGSSDVPHRCRRLFSSMIKRRPCRAEASRPSKALAIAS